MRQILTKFHHIPLDRAPQLFEYASTHDQNLIPLTWSPKMPIKVAQPLFYIMCDNCGQFSPSQKASREESTSCCDNVQTRSAARANTDANLTQVTSNARCMAPHGGKRKQNPLET